MNPDIYLQTIEIIEIVDLFCGLMGFFIGVITTLVAGFIGYILINKIKNKPKKEK